MAPPMVRRLLQQAYGDPDKVSDELVTFYFDTINGAGHRASLGSAASGATGTGTVALPVGRALRGIRPPGGHTGHWPDDSQPALAYGLADERPRSSSSIDHNSA